MAKFAHKLRTMTGRQWMDLLVQNAIYLVILAIILTIIILDPRFLSLRVLENILTQSSVRLILALGVAGIIILQGTDLSLGRMVGLAAVISASLLQRQDYAGRFYPNLETVPVLLPMLAAIFGTVLFSAISGWVVAQFKIHPFLATLGMMTVLYGVIQIYFDMGAGGAQPIGGHDRFYTAISTGRLVEFSAGGTRVGIPYLVLIAATVSLVIWVIWNKTVFGKNMYAVGGNPDAAKVSGVNVMGTTIMVYVMAGILYGIGGYLEAARIGSANPSTGFGYELDAIAACVVGGISFSGGIGKVSGAIAGVLMFTIISYGMTFVGLEQYYQYIIKGVIIVVAVALDTKKYLRRV
ncbi:Galactose/methyl galactoside ABC transport system, permease protein MglC (TC 3.A.1.2.3) [Olavius algarvensis spirochete endosymbiont]|uniref:galactose/methyl galactoside ABC transporter permease MglC n=1 Tax=Olavius algarvensis spirochete endosymbiont TaxID=260710 RepID=UPI0006917037|nr:galactose/methyl galactoside ABC transporter permease MglC [Olavius algarvensis spirochete endosymbiont]CAD7846089.1 MAG: Galactose/methyl galactoside ABC transporter, permease protein MglC (EC 3.6.3.17) [Olavius algarvensis spirochete endosymbiont]VDA99235.1 Galactose/methyl galactoside ABC transport system, permease protein MglC (TC 3.A.1.2.3) [Olavius algarvensis spirochete endosymbiont]